MFNSSLDSANLWFDRSNLALIVGAVLVLLGTFGVWKMGGLKEKYADERISFNENETARAKLAAAEANENAEIVRRANLLLQSDLERERTARLKIESKIAPRHLSSEETKIIADAIRPFAGQAVRITIPLGNVEARTYAEDFVQAFRLAGWDPGDSDVIPQSGYSEAIIGVLLLASELDREDPPASIIRLLDALKGLGILKMGDIDRNLEKGSIVLAIGSKPL